LFLPSRKIRVFGDTAVVHGSESDEVEVNGKRFAVRYVYLDVLRRRDGEWKLVASQLARPLRVMLMLFSPGTLRPGRLDFDFFASTAGPYTRESLAAQFSLARSRFCQCDHRNQAIPADQRDSDDRVELWKYLPSERQFSPSFMPK
jgi:hypothetical protein